VQQNKHIGTNVFVWVQGRRLSVTRRGPVSLQFVKRQLADVLVTIFGAGARITASAFDALSVLFCGGDSNVSRVRGHKLVGRHPSLLSSRGLVCSLRWTGCQSCTRNSRRAQAQ
jgi:hypothetical protein